MTPLHVLVIDDSESDMLLEKDEIRRGGFDPTIERADSVVRVHEMLHNVAWDVILVDFVMQHLRCSDVIRMVRETHADIPIILVSGKIGEETAAEVLQAGVYDYVMKNNLKLLTPAIRRALEGSRLRREREKVEAEFHQAQKMESVGRLAGGVAHDFNNILTVITGYTELVMARLGRADPSYNDLLEIKHSTLQASALTRQLLLFSRKQLVHHRVLDLNDVVDKMKNMLQRLIGEDIELNTILSPKIPHVKIDHGHLEQIIMNLSVNARDAMPDGGTLVIQSDARELDVAEAAMHPFAEAGRHVVLSVSDTGCGMDAKTQAHLFEPFFTTKEQGKGTGLGLATVYAIVRQRDGHIQVESVPNKGSTFHIFLPATDAPVEISLPPSQAPAPNTLDGKETILVVEDEDVIRNLARRVLSERGYRVLAARQGEEALALCQVHEGPIDLVLTDMIMPHMGGRQFADSFVQTNPGAKILYMSGYTDRMADEQGLLKEGTNFLQKPFAPRDLVVRVRALLDGTP